MAQAAYKNWELSKLEGLLKNVSKTEKKLSNAMK